MGLAHPGSARGQANAWSEEANIRFGNPTQRTVCEESNADQSVEAALRLVCLRDILGTRKVAVIGFVGGFVRSDDVKHPEVQFAALLRQRYPSILHAEVFANHDGKNALRRVLHLLDTDGDGASLVQGGCSEICPPVHEKYEAGFSPLHMNWILVDDTKGNCRAQMRGVADR
jgi:hypothetical protein